MRRTGRPDPARPNASSWAGGATRYLIGIAIIVAAVAGWRAATRRPTPDARLADRAGVALHEHPGLTSGTAGGAAGPEPPDPVSSVVPDASPKPARSGARWTAEDDAYLAAHMEDALDDVAHHLGRTPSAVSLRRSTLRREGR